MESVLTILLITACFVFAIIIRCNRAEIRGKIGERRIASILDSLPENYYKFHDIYLQVNDHYTQIDHILISAYGIFVIETKNYTGWIFGTKNAEEWTKNRYGYKYRFRNPLKQNYAHVKTLQNLLGLSQDKFIPIVVFLKGATLKCHTQSTVVNSSQLKKVIYSYTTPVWDVSDTHKLAYRLSSATITDKKVRKAHITTIRQYVHRNKLSIRNGICPRCGGRLVERNGRYGKFMGCSNYPSCRFTTSGCDYNGKYPLHRTGTAGPANSGFQAGTVNILSGRQKD